MFPLRPAIGETMLGFVLWMGLTQMATLPPTTMIIPKLYGAPALPPQVALAGATAR